MIFKTNKKDRAVFAKVLGLIEYIHADPRAWTHADLRTDEDKKILGKEDGKWYFYNDGYQWTIQKLVSLGLFVYVLDGETVLDVIGSNSSKDHGNGYSKDIGESLFKAVVDYGKRNGVEG